MDGIENQVDEVCYALDGIEGGSAQSADTYNRIKGFDPVIIYFFIRYLRDKYPPTHQASPGVVARVVELTSTYTDIVKKSQKGEKDLVSEWFNESYAMREFFNDKEKLFTLLMEKLEG